MNAYSVNKDRVSGISNSCGSFRSDDLFENDSDISNSHQSSASSNFRGPQNQSTLYSCVKTVKTNSRRDGSNMEISGMLSHEINDRNKFFRPISPDSIYNEVIYESPLKPNNVGTSLTKCNGLNTGLSTNSSFILPNVDGDQITFVEDSDKSSSSILELSDEVIDDSFPKDKVFNANLVNSTKKHLIRQWLNNVSLNCTSTPQTKHLKEGKSCYDQENLKSNQVLKQVVTSPLKDLIRRDNSNISDDHERIIATKKLSLRSNGSNIDSKLECKTTPKNVRGGYNFRKSRKANKENLQALYTSDSSLSPGHTGRKNGNRIPSPIKLGPMNHKISFQKKKNRKMNITSVDEGVKLSSIVDSIMCLRVSSEEEGTKCSGSLPRKDDFQSKKDASNDCSNPSLNIDCFTPRRKLFSRNKLNSSFDDESCPVQNDKSYSSLTNVTPLSKPRSLRDLNALLNDGLKTPLRKIVTDLKGDKKKHCEIIHSGNIDKYKHFKRDSVMEVGKPYPERKKGKQLNTNIADVNTTLENSKTEERGQHFNISSDSECENLICASTPNHPDKNGIFDNAINIGIYPNKSIDNRLIKSPQSAERNESDVEKSEIKELIIRDGDKNSCEFHSNSVADLSKERCIDFIVKDNVSLSSKKCPNDSDRGNISTEDCELLVECPGLIDSRNGKRYTPTKNYPILNTSEYKSDNDSFINIRKSGKKLKYFNSSDSSDEDIDINNFDERKMPGNIQSSNEASISHHSEMICTEFEEPSDKNSNFLRNVCNETGKLMTSSFLDDSNVGKNTNVKKKKRSLTHSAIISSGGAIATIDSILNTSSCDEISVSDEDLNNPSANKNEKFGLNCYISSPDDRKKNSASKRISQCMPEHPINENTQADSTLEGENANANDNIFQTNNRNRNSDEHFSKKSFRCSTVSNTTDTMPFCNNSNMSENSFSKKEMHSQYHNNDKSNEFIRKKKDGSDLQVDGNIFECDASFQEIPESKRDFNLQNRISGSNNLLSAQNENQSSDSSLTPQKENCSIIVLSDSEDSFSRVMRSKTPPKKRSSTVGGQSSLNEMLEWIVSPKKTTKGSRKKIVNGKYDPAALIYGGHDSSNSSDVEVTGACYEIDSHNSSSDNNLSEEGNKEPWADLASYLKKSAAAVSVGLDSINKRIMSDVPLPSHSSSPNHTSFLLSLTETVPEEMCHPEAVKYRESFQVHKNTLIDLLFKLYNQEIFDSQLPPLDIKWSGHLTTTSGVTRSSLRTSEKTGKVRTSEIKLSKTVVDNPAKLRDVLIHELCHAANWLIDRQAGGHGSLFRKWADKVWSRFPELPKVNVCHRYDINWKYKYKCTYCGYEIGKMKLSLKRDTCGLCGGRVTVIT